MILNEILIERDEFSIKTHLEKSSENVIHNRYASAIILVLSGSIDFHFSHKAIYLQSGEAVFVPEHDSYRLFCRESAESLVINFHLTDTPLQASALGKTDVPSAISIFEQLSQCLRSPDTRRNRIFSLYYQLFALFSDNIQRPSDPSESLVIKAETIIDTEYDQPTLSCEGIAHRLHISEVYLRKLFVKYRGIPPMKYILQTRMNKARQFLLEGYSVSAAAEAVGYADIYQFSRAYKKHYGVTPKKHFI